MDNMTDRILFTYGEFYDYPRMIEFQFGNAWYFLNSPFDEVVDDYPNYYHVYLLPFRSEEELKSNPYYWKDLTAAEHLGRIAIADIGFDETRRKSIDAAAFLKLLPREPKQRTAG